MYKSRITVYMRNGKTLVGIYTGTEASTGDVATKLFSKSTMYVGITNECDNGTLYIKEDEIIGFDITYLGTETTMLRDVFGRPILNLKERLEEENHGSLE